MMVVNALYPATFDLLISIVLAEYCRVRNTGRRMAWREPEKTDLLKSEEADIEKYKTSAHNITIYQWHLHKKGIMFTSFIFSIVLADLLGTEFILTSDSDSILLPDSIEGTVQTIASDPLAGGGSSGLVAHNATDTLVTNLASEIYWCEPYLTRSLTASTGCSDCQSGPSAAFRVSALRSIVVPWYNQKVFGKKMTSHPSHESVSFKP